MSAGRWCTLSLAEQLGNIGSEVGRAIMRQQEGDRERFQSAFDRALELLDFTCADPRWLHLPRLQELLRTREVLCDYFYGDNQHISTPESLEKYFYHFAFAARKDR